MIKELRVPEESKKPVTSITAEQELKILGEISALVQQSEAHNESLEKVLKCLGKIIDYRSASLYLISSESDQLEEVCTVGRKVELIDFVNFDMGSGISAWVAKHKRPIVLNNLRKSRGGTHTKSFLSVPIVFGNKIGGVLNLAHDEPDSFTRRDAEIVSIIATVLALLLERISHLEIMVQKSKELEALSEELRIAKDRQAEADKFLKSDDLAAVLHQKISNPMAIISGNAQFLQMTMKNSTPSVLKRLMAIEKEASGITNFINDYFKVAGNQVHGKTHSVIGCQSFSQN